MNTSIILHLLWLRRRLHQRDHWTRPQLEAHQAAALHELRGFAYERSPFYQRFHRGLAGRPLHELPVLTKSELMASFDDLVTDRDVRLADAQAYLAAGDPGRFLGRYLVAATAGSTGLRGIFLTNQQEWATILASYARANDWAGIKAGLTRRMKLAVVSSRNPSHQSALVGATLQSRWVPTVRLDATEPLDRIVSRLNEFQPESLVGYASMLRLLAEEQIAGRLKVTPGAVMSASEVLTEASAWRMEQAWGTRPFNVYGATEAAGIASECDRHNGLHLYEDLVITEVVDSHNRPVPPGLFGEKVLVTVLFSRTQPLIRYEISDCVRLSSNACDCGRPFRLVDGIQGRQEDILTMEGPAGQPVDIHPNVFHGVMDLAPASAWQVVQDDGCLRILLVGVHDDFDEDALTAPLRKALTLQGVAPPAIRVERVASIPRTALGKAPLVRRASPTSTAGSQTAL